MTNDSDDLYMRRCRKRIDEMIETLRETADLVQVVEDYGDRVLVQVANGEVVGDWFKVDGEAVQMWVIPECAESKVRLKTSIMTL